MRQHILFLSVIGALGVTAAGPAIATDTKPKPSLPSQPAVVTGQPIKPGVVPVKPGAAEDKSVLTLWPPIGPDLVVSLPNPMNGSVTVRNIGSLGAKETTLQLYCTRAGWTGSRASDPSSGCAGVPGLAWCSYTDHSPGCTVLRIPPLLPRGTYVYTVPSWSTLRWDSGNYEFGANVNPFLSLKETNTGNNTAKSTLTVAARNEPDLVPVLNNPMNGTLIVRNDGRAAAPPTRLRLRCFYYFREAGINPMCPEIPPRFAPEYSWDPSSPYREYMFLNIPTLAPGATYRIALPFWRFVRWLSGNYQFTAVADFDRVVLESNEGNNSGVSTMVVP